MPTRTESECTTSSFNDDELEMGELWDMDGLSLPVAQSDPKKDEPEGDDESKSFVTLRERRQIKLGLRKILPLNVLIPKAKVTAKNKKWYDALKKVWHHKDPWQSSHLTDLPEKVAMRHRYDPIKQKWHEDKVRIKMEDKPFNRGAMRQCFRLKKLSKFCNSEDWHHAGNYVAKKYMESVDRSVYFEDVKLQMDAKLWGEEYNRHNPPKKIDIFQMYIIELVEDEGSPLYHLEHFIEGEYIKYNSNSGFVEDTKQCRHTPQAFSHFTFERSGHEMIVVDVQGVGDLYTDPQIHTMDGLKYGEGNLGTKGMALFFHSHECNDICKGLGLEHFDLSDAEKLAVLEHHASTPSSITEVRLTKIEHVVSPSQADRQDLKRMLSNPSRQRTLSTLSDLGSLPEDENSIHSALAPQISIDSGINQSDQRENILNNEGATGDGPITGCPCDTCSPTGQSSPPPQSDEGVSLTGSVSEDPNLLTPISRSRFMSMSSDDYPYDTSECCSSSVPSTSASLTKSMEQKLNGQPRRSTRVTSEHLLRHSSDFHLGDSVLGQVHHELAKYHEIGRFALDGDEKKIDWQSALFHEEHAANLGIPEAIITMAKIYLHLPHDVLVSCEVGATDVNTNKGVEFMIHAAQANDRASILYMAKAYHTGYGLGTDRDKSYKEAVDWYTTAMHTQENDAHGEFDATMADPNYLILATQAEMYLEGGFELEKDPSRAGELYTEAADEAMAAMKGRLANQYYMKAEEAWAEVEE